MSGMDMVYGVSDCWGCKGNTFTQFFFPPINEKCYDCKVLICGVLCWFFAYQGLPWIIQLATEELMDLFANWDGSGSSTMSSFMDTHLWTVFARCKNNKQSESWYHIASCSVGRHRWIWWWRGGDVPRVPRNCSTDELLSRRMGLGCTPFGGSGPGESHMETKCKGSHNSCIKFTCAHHALPYKTPSPRPAEGPLAETDPPPPV